MTKFKTKGTFKANSSKQLQSTITIIDISVNSTQIGFGIEAQVIYN